MNRWNVFGWCLATGVILGLAATVEAQRVPKGNTAEGIAGVAGCGCEGDLNNDNVIDGADLGILLAAWGQTNTPANLNGTGTVDGADLGILLAAWGPCNEPPSNDFCSDAELISSGQFQFCTLNATSSGPDACTFAGSAQINKDIWYRWIAPDAGTLEVSTCGAATFDTKMAIYGSILPGVCSCPGGQVGLATLLACDDDTAGCSANTTKLSISVAAGSCYHIRLGGFGSAAGTGTLSVSFTPSGDSCGKCIQITGVNVDVQIDATTNGNTAEGLEESICGFNDKIDEWYCYKVACAGDVRIDTFGSELDTVLSVFTGTCGIPEIADNLTQIACNDDYDFNENGQINPPEERASLVFLDNLNFNDLIYIRVAGFNNTKGNYKLRIICTNCCGGHSSVGCFPFGACENCICNIDPFCCNTMWDGSCAGKADSSPCDQFCPCDD